jgi:hypothetical protein
VTGAVSRSHHRAWSLRSSVSIAILASAAVAAGGCGGTHDALRTSGSRDGAFVAQAQRICARAKTQLNALPAFPFKHFDALHPDSHDLPKVGRFFTGSGNELPIVRRLDAQLHELGAPPANLTGWSATLTTLDRYIAVFRQEDAAALRADAAAWVQAVRRNRRLHERLAHATTEFGARGCDVL